MLSVPRADRTTHKTRRALSFDDGRRRPSRRRPSRRRRPRSRRLPGLAAARADPRGGRVGDSLIEIEGEEVPVPRSARRHVAPTTPATMPVRFMAWSARWLDRARVHWYPARPVTAPAFLPAAPAAPPVRRRAAAGSTPWRRIRWPIAAAVVEPTRSAPVALRRPPARRPRLDVVGLAAAGGHVAQLLEALAVAHLDGPA